MDDKSLADRKRELRLTKTWRKSSAGGADEAFRVPAAGDLGEARSFGAPALSGSPGQVIVRETRGSHEVWAEAPGRDLTVTQLSPGPCLGQLLRANLGDMDFDAGGFDGDLRVRGTLARKAFSIVSVLERGGATNQWGHPVAEGDILVVPPGEDLDGRFQGRTAYAVVTVPSGLLMRRAEAFEWLAEPRCWTEVAVYSPPPPARAPCRDLLRNCAALIRTQGEGLPARTIDVLRQDLLDGVLTALAQAKAPAARRPGVLNAARIVRGAEDLIEGGGTRRTIQIDDVCRGLNISRRTLYRAFQDLLDVSPKAYLRMKNLSAARARLLDATRRPTTVTQVALDHGFWELGRFAGAYRTMFGESPSETLRANGGLRR